MNIYDLFLYPDDDRIDHTPPKKPKSNEATPVQRTRRETTRQRKISKGRRNSISEIDEIEKKIREGMERASTDASFEGLSQV